MNGKKPWYKNWGIYLIGAILLVLIIVVPIIINELYKYGLTATNAYSTMWEAKDVLGFYGSFLAFMGTVSLGYVAYKQNEKANQTNDKLAKLTEQANLLNIDFNERNIKMAVRPTVILIRLRTWYSGNIFAALAAGLIQNTETEDELENIPIEESTLRYYEDEINGFYFSLSEINLSFSHIMKPETEQKIKEKIHVQKKPKEASIVSVPILYAPFRLMSVGNGPVINMSLRLYKEDKVGDVNFDVATYALSLKNNVEYNVGIFVDTPEKCQGKYTMLIEYYDVYNNKYHQTHDLIIEGDTIQFNLDVQQQEEK